MLRYVGAAFALALFSYAPALGQVQSASPSAAAASASANPSGPAPYEFFVRGATVEPGLIPIIKKAGNIYLAISRDQLDKDFIQSAVPATGLGGFGPAAGEPYVAPARLLRFQRVDDRVILRWPNTYAQVTPNTPYATSIGESFPNSVLAVVPVVAESASGTVVIPAASFLGDVANYQAVFNQRLDPSHTYRLDTSRTYFMQAKAFPENDVLRVSQTWASQDPNLVDNAPDPRSLEVTMTYNLIAAPHDGYIPRISDPRVGYFEQPLLDFTRDRSGTRNLYYIARWNFAPQNPAQRSNATHPLTFYMSNDMPFEYRNVVKQALLTWNGAFDRIGILNAVQVLQQPADASWDADDIRHNMVRWVSTTSPQYGAEALIITDPRSGEELNVGINVDAVEGLLRNTYRYVIAPARGLRDTETLEREFALDYLRSTVLHESGHDLGLQHNFIGSMAYTKAQLQSMAFTSGHGIASSVMEYAPVNLWPKGMRQGAFNQDVLGPYDYYAIRYGYAHIPGAMSTQAESPTLNRWASQWSNPVYRFASDEDASFGTGHAVDPRVQQFDLTDHPLAWCQTQLKMMHGLMDAVNRRFPGRGQSYEDARLAFQSPLRTYTRCAVMPAHTIGGEYLSRSRAGDPHSGPPLSPVSRAANYQAWQMLAANLFSDAAWRFNPDVLNRLVYREVSSFTDASWAYNPSLRHDLAVSQIAATAQEQALSEMFAPLTLQRIDDLPLKYSHRATIGLTDLFDWSHNGIFGNIATGGFANDGLVRRNLQMRFARRLGQMWTSPARGTPTDAQSLARSELERLINDTGLALRRRNLDEMSRAHAGALRAMANQALQARATIAPPVPGSTQP